MSALFLLLFGVLCTGIAQVDPHFSQYYAYPGFINPALTGVMDGNYRATVLYRSQWQNMDGGFKTPGLLADIKAGENISLGVNVMNQSAAGGLFNYLNSYASFAFTGLRFGKQGYHRVSLGISAGVINSKVNPGKFRSGSQWSVSEGFDPSLPTQEFATKTAASSFDAGAGAVYFDGTPNRKANMFIGMSVWHLTRPTLSFAGTGNEQKIPVRITAHGGVRINLQENFSLVPNLLYMKQGQAEEKMLGAYGQYTLNTQSDLMLGFNYRWDDALVPYVGITYKDFVLGASYDATISDLGKVAGNVNSFEISLSFMGRKKQKGEPVPYVCPRL
jgi:type IX secretion system PorP/SprF family membrane protein